MKKLLLLVAVVLSLAITGCGGGSSGGGGTTPPSSHPFEGTWTGTLSAINPTILVVANDGYSNSRANVIRCSFIIDNDGYIISASFDFEGTFDGTGNYSDVGGSATGYVDNIGNISGLITPEVVCHVSNISFSGVLTNNNLSIQFSIDGRTFDVPVVKS